MKSYNLDLVGNDTASGGVYNNLNQLTENNGFTFIYDDNGNLVQKSNKPDGSKIEYVWDAENVLHQTKVFKTSSTLSKTIDYKYDGLGRRIERSVTDHLVPTKSYARKYVYDGEHILAILDGSNNIVAVYLHGQGIDEPMGLVTDYDGDGELDVLSLIKDHQNSVKWILDEKGSWVERIKYSAYGETEIISRNQKKVTMNNIFFYTGRELEPETGDYYYRARYYSPSEGRFLSEDPISFMGGDFNLYQYVKNNPMRYRDPLGLAGWDDVLEAWRNAYEAIKRGKDKMKDNLKDIKDWGDRIIEDAMEELKKFFNDEEEEEKLSGGYCPAKRVNL